MWAPIRGSSAGSPTAILQAQASSGGWIVSVWKRAARGDVVEGEADRETGWRQKIVWPMKPLGRCAVSRLSSSARARAGSKRRQTIAAKQESQYHCHG